MQKARGSNPLSSTGFSNRRSTNSDYVLESLLGIEVALVILRNLSGSTPKSLVNVRNTGHPRAAERAGISELDRRPWAGAAMRITGDWRRPAVGSPRAHGESVRQNLGRGVVKELA
jgi:hypothetical protein